MLSVSYLYDLPLPSPKAATIQILNTCRALVDLGARATVYAGPVRRHECAGFYGIDPHEAFRLVALFSRITGRPELRWRLRRILRDAAGAARHVVMSRGEPGVAVLPRIRRLHPPQFHAPGVRSAPARLRAGNRNGCRGAAGIPAILFRRRPPVSASGSGTPSSPRMPSWR